MTGKLSHLQVNVKRQSLPFFEGVFTQLGWEPLFAVESGVAFNSDGDISLWFMAEANDAQNDMDGPGVNHIALAADSQAEVDATVAYLAANGIECLFETPRHRPDFARSENDTYYQVMFASPEGILLEHVYIGPKQDA